MSTSATNVIGLLDAGAPDAAAISTPGGIPLTYHALRALAAETVAALNAKGIGRGDRVAIVLDNGPEMAAAFLCVAAGATAAPLNPAYRAEEFEFYLSDLHARILIIERDKASPVVDVANKLGVPIVRLVATPGRGAGSFALTFSDSTGTNKTSHSGPAAPAPF